LIGADARDVHRADPRLEERQAAAAPRYEHRAAADLDLDLARSIVVGDRWHDIQAGQKAGTRTVLVRTGYGRTEEQQPKPGVAADAIVENLIGAVSWILREAR
jgi:D-glycero-D-manno-heptose 1,7-bisphosphate phosphatase